MTWGNGSSGVSGEVSSSNSLVGTQDFDQVGSDGITALSNGNYVVSSGSWNNGSAQAAGAVTWGNGSSGVSGEVSSLNSLVGLQAFDFYGSIDAGEGRFSGVSEVAGNRFTINSDSFGPDNEGLLQLVTANASGGSLSNASSFGNSPGEDVVLSPAQIAATANTGTAVILQANNDITLRPGSDIVIDNPAGTGGSAIGGNFTLQAGRSINLQSSLSTDGSSLTLWANDPAAIDAFRDPGLASITMAGGTSINLNTNTAGAADGALSVKLFSDPTQAGQPGFGQAGAGEAGIASLQNITAGLITVDAQAGLTLNGILSATATSADASAPGFGRPLVLNSGSGLFSNNAGSGVLNVSTGNNWLIYAYDQQVDANDLLTLYTTGSFDFKQYGKSFYADTPLAQASGNAAVYGFSPNPITVSLEGTVSKVYDGNTEATVVPGFGFPGNFAVSGILDGDILGIGLPSSGNYTSDGTGVGVEDVGTGKRVAVIGIAISPFQFVYGYQLSSDMAIGDVGEITARPLTATSIDPGNSIYGSALSPGAVNLTNIVGSEQVAASASVNVSTLSSSGNPIVGAYTQSASGALTGVDAANYSFSGFTTATPNYSINKLALSGAAIAAGSSIYGSALTPGAVSFANIFSADVVGSTASVNTSTLSSSGNPIVGVYTQSASTTLSGADAGNYSFSGFTTATPNYDIEKLSLAGTGITGSSSIYGSALRPGGVSILNVLSGDDVSATASVNTGEGDFSSSGNLIAGTYFQSASGALTGVDAANYALSGFTTETPNYEIEKLDLTISGFTVNNKVYDGTTQATINTDSAAYIGLIAGDSVAASGGLGLFSDPNVGLAKSVDVSGLTLGGTDAGNYNFASPSTTLSADITIRPLATWRASTAGNWSDAANWDALPSAANVAVVAIPVGTGAVTYDAAAGSTNLQNLLNDQSLNLTGGSLAVSGTTTVGTGATLSLNGGSFSTSSLVNQGLVNGSGPLVLNGTYSENGGSLGNGFSSAAITQISGDLSLKGVGATGPVNLISVAGGLNLIGAVSSAGGPISLSSSGATQLAAGSSLTSPGALISVNSGGPLSLLGARVDASGGSVGGTVQLDGSSINLSNATLDSSGASDGGSIQIGLKALPSSVTISNSSLIADPPALGGSISIDAARIPINGSTFNVIGLRGGSILLGSRNTASLSLDAFTSLTGGGRATFNLFGDSILNNARITGGELFENGVAVGNTVPPVIVVPPGTTSPSIPPLVALLPPIVSFLQTIDPIQPSLFDTTVDYTAPGSPLFTQWEQLGIDQLSITLAESAFLYADLFESGDPSTSAVWEWPKSPLFNDLGEDLPFSVALTEDVGLDRLLTSPQQLYPSQAFAGSWPEGSLFSLSFNGLGLFDPAVQQLTPLQVQEQFTASEKRAMDVTAAKLGLDPTNDQEVPTPSQLQRSLREVIKAVRARIRGGQP